ncbi:tape measure protein [uncultured Enterococcus sp.]|jgi:tape measure domain-containing protein|uniref:aggregation-promoting factor C-terminal-like domain-containing protein n=1 Tax=uncultured Enterococcus sp. TaxID=167972 RepID=UPI00206771D3|nr:tape measure protein [uncultured Enterococcus sp.]DAL95787.1 MAG TPA: tail tape measure [Caudoviricetes sp.]
MAGKGKPAGNIKLGISLDGTSFGNTLDEINAKVKQAESNMKANLKAYDSAGRSYEALNQKTKDLSTVMDGQSAKVKELTKRRDEAIDKYGEESKEVTKLNTQINNATAKYNAYGKQLNDTKKELVYSQTAVNDLTDEIKENERQMNAEVKALKAAGDQSGAFEAKQKGLTKQAELSERALDEQRKVVSLMADEFGDSADETEDARKELTKLERQSKLSDKQLEGLTKTTDVAGKEIDDFGDQATKSGRSIDGFKDRVSKTTGVVSNLGKGVAFMAKGAVFGAFATVGSKAVNMVSDSLDGAISRIDTLNNSDRAFSNMGFSAEETKKAMDNLQGAIKGLPTGLDGAVKGVQLLAGSTEDVEKSVDIFKAMNDGILGFGGNAEMVDNAIVQLSQSFSNGKVDAETWNSMINSGLGPTLNAMAKQMGKTTGELKAGLSDGSISVKEFQDRLIDLDKNGGGGIKSLNQIAKDSTKGISTSISNAKTAITRGVATMITNLNDGLAKNKLPTLSDMISNVGIRAEAVFKKIGNVIPQVLGAIAPVVNKAIGVFKNLFTVFTESNDPKKYSKALFDLDKIIPMEVLTKIRQRVTQIKNLFNGIFATGEKQNKSLNVLKMSGMTDETLDKIKNFSNDVKKLVGSIFGNKTADKGMLQRLGLKDEDITKIKNVIEDLKVYFGSVLTNLQQAFGVAIEIAKGVFNTLSPYVIPIISKIGKALGDIGKSLTLFWEQNGKQIIEAIKNFFVFIQPVVKIVMTLFMGFIDNVIGLVKGLLNAIQGAIKIFTGIFTGDLGKMWEGIKQLFSGAIQAIWNFIQIMFFKRLIQGVSGLASGFKSIVKGLWDGARNLFQQGINGVGSSVVSWISNTLSRVGGLKNSFINLIKNLWNSIKTLFSGGISNTWSAIKGWASNLISHIGNLKNSLINVIKSMWSTIKNTFSNGISTVVNWMKGLPGQIANGIKAGVGVVKDAFESIFKSAMNAVKKPINLIIDGASWVLEKLGGDKIKHWNPGYAQGTDGHPGGMMTVNDGAGAEMVVRPNGQAFIPQGQNITMYGEPGTQVIPAHDTAMLMGKKRSTFAYAKGTGGMFSNLWSNVKDVGSGILDGVKNAIGDVMDYIDDPGKLVSKLLGSNLLGGLTKWPLDVGGGILKKAKDALTAKVKEMFDSMSSGSFDGAMNANGVYQYLVDVAKKVMAKFSGLTITSGYRAGDVYHHGRHQAIDISGYPVGSPRYTEAANYAFEKFPRDVGYVITNGRVRDRIGFSGTGVHDGWATWPAGDHFDHVHISGSKGAGEIYSGGSNSSGKSPKPTGSHENWMRLAGFKPSEYSAINYIVNHESSWNPSATNASSGAYGLPQSLPASKLASAGSDWRTNPITQLKWMRNYVNERYGGANGALSFWKRNHWYANGGIVNQHQIAEIAEGNKPEIIIPLDSAKRSRAMQLLGIAMDKLGVSPAGPTADSKSIPSLETIVTLMIQQNNLLAKLLAKDTSVNLDGSEIANSTNNHLGKRFDQALYTAG